MVSMGRLRKHGLAGGPGAPRRGFPRGWGIAGSGPHTVRGLSLTGAREPRAPDDSQRFYPTCRSFHPLRGPNSSLVQAESIAERTESPQRASIPHRHRPVDPLVTPAPAAAPATGTTGARRSAGARRPAGAPAVRPAAAPPAPPAPPAPAVRGVPGGRHDHAHEHAQERDGDDHGDQGFHRLSPRPAASCRLCPGDSRPAPPPKRT
ncbi:hypothetical protein CP979_16865 [Streptomyces filamentosus]|nr:hypothetical protein CP979_16865 [Streptomyces filamentosus]